MPTVYPIPSLLSEESTQFIAPIVQEIMKECRHFVVENAKPARKFIKFCHPEAVLRDYDLFELSPLTKNHKLWPSLEQWLDKVEKEDSVGLLSDAGSPGIADPGAIALHSIHRREWIVHPIPGSSAIMMALTASGFNGQAFTFHGYLPIETKARVQQLKTLEAEIKRSGASQAFMETPYRNGALLELLFKTLSPETYLHISAGLLSKQQLVSSKPIKKWKKKAPHLHKVPAVFVLGNPIMD